MSQQYFITSLVDVLSLLCITHAVAGNQSFLHLQQKEVLEHKNAQFTFFPRQNLMTILYFYHDLLKTPMSFCVTIVSDFTGRFSQEQQNQVTQDSFEWNMTPVHCFQRTCP